MENCEDVIYNIIINTVFSVVINQMWEHFKPENMKTF